MTTADRLTVLVTGVGDTVGQALVKAARQSTVPVRVLGTDLNEICVGLRWVDKGFVLPHCSAADDYLAQLAAVCAGEGVQLILPGTEKELELLAAHAATMLSQSGAVVVASTPDVLRVSMNKWETCRFLAAEGLNFPRFARLDAADEVRRLVDEVGFPLIVKPFHGQSSRGLLKVRSWADINSARGSGIPAVVQEFLEPDHEEYSVAVYTARDGRPVGAFSYLRQQLMAGSTYRARIGHNPIVESEALAVAGALHPSGPCNIQLRLTSAGPITFEINARFSGGVSMRAHFGYNDVEMAIRDLILNEPVPPPVTTTGTALRYWDEMYFDDEPTLAAERGFAVGAS
jgi:carbamoyl-phosphate synthase large subunit